MVDKRPHHCGELTRAGTPCQRLPQKKPDDDGKYRCGTHSPHSRAGAQGSRESAAVRKALRQVERAAGLKEPPKRDRGPAPYADRARALGIAPDDDGPAPGAPEKASAVALAALERLNSLRLDGDEGRIYALEDALIAMLGGAIGAREADSVSKAVAVSKRVAITDLDEPDTIVDFEVIRDPGRADELAQTDDPDQNVDG